MTKSFPDDAHLRVARVYDIANAGPRRRFIANGKVVSNCNWQNLPSQGAGAVIRHAMMAPPGTKFAPADASQVEARMVAWLAEHIPKLEAFRRYDRGVGPDIYCVSASDVFMREILKDRDKFERFIGKVLELSCQYGAGAKKIQNTLAQGFRGAPPVFMPLHEVQQHVKAWRYRANKPIIDYWTAIESAMMSAWIRGQGVQELGPLAFELHNGNGYMHLPNGTYQVYLNPRWVPDESKLYFSSRNGPTSIWGGHATENAAQALCCALLKHHMIEMQDEMPDLRIALTVHDEVVPIIEEEKAEEYTAKIKRIMSKPANWCQGLPLNAAVVVSDRYEKPE